MVPLAVLAGCLGLLAVDYVPTVCRRSWMRWIQGTYICTVIASYITVVLYILLDVRANVLTSRQDKYYGISGVVRLIARRKRMSSQGGEWIIALSKTGGVGFGETRKRRKMHSQ